MNSYFHFFITFHDVKFQSPDFPLLAHVASKTFLLESPEPGAHLNLTANLSHRFFMQFYSACQRVHFFPSWNVGYYPHIIGLALFLPLFTSPGVDSTSVVWRCSSLRDHCFSRTHRISLKKFKLSILRRNKA